MFWASHQFQTGRMCIFINHLARHLEFKTAAGLAPFNSALDSKRAHSFLAARQQTRLAVLPIHTTAERALFSQLMKSQTTGKPPWGKVVLDWNRAAEENPNGEIFYKVG
jgi:hypothetical protein